MTKLVKENKKYRSQVLLKKFSKERNSWDELYDSERYIFNKFIPTSNTSISILDAGCACGGLLRALEEKHFNIDYYKGIDINEQMIEFAKSRNDFVTRHEFECLDICELSDNEEYDVVISLSCIDWNNDVLGMLNKCWQKVRPGGHLILSIRLTNKESVLSSAYQYLDGDNEKYNYVVFNLFDFFETVTKLEPKPSCLNGYGYWGKPSKTAVIGYDYLCFSVFAIQKSSESSCDYSRIKIDLPMDLIINLNNFYDTKSL